MVNWKEFWNKLSSSTDNIHKQVGRQGNLWEDRSIIQLTVNNIIKHLNPEKEHHLLDICCGNGYLTELLKPHFKKVTGIDLSHVQIELANSRKIKDAEFLVADAMNLNEIESEKFDRVLCYFSFQYFDNYNKGKQAIYEMSRVLKPGGILFLGDITDKAKKWMYYNTLEKKIILALQNLKGNNIMGKFWHRDELDKICEELGLEGKLIEQIPKLPHSYYRFDYVINKELVYKIE